MKWMKKLFAVAMASAMALTLFASCAPIGSNDTGNNNGGNAGAEKVFRFATSTEPTSLDPQLGSGTWITNVTGAIFEGWPDVYLPPAGRCLVGWHAHHGTGLCGFLESAH